MKPYISCARCGRTMTTGGHTRPNQCCADCVTTDPKFCARLMGVKVAMPPRGNNEPAPKAEPTPEQIEARRLARNEYKRRRRAEGKGEAA